MRAYLLTVLLLAGAAAIARTTDDDIEETFKQLKAAEAAKDAALVKQFAVETCNLAKKRATEPPPENDAQKEWWAKHLVYLQDVQSHAEYALFSTAIQSPPAATVDLLSTLEQLNPASKYLDDAYPSYFFALSKTGAAAKIPAVAERALKNFPNNEDALVVMADSAMDRKQTDRAAVFAERAIAVLAKHPKPDGLPAADWERKRSLATGRCRWIAGVAHGEKGQHYEADRDLRAALPLIAGNDTMTASALFYLGVANYQLGAAMRDRARILEAAKFSDQAAAIKGPLSQHAWRNAQAMRAEAQKLR